MSKEKTITEGPSESQRVLYHLRTQGTGSEGIHIRGMVTAFRKKGYTVDFLWPLGEGDPTVRAGVNPYDTKKRKSPFELVIPLIPGPVFAILEFCYNFWSYRRLRQILRKRSYQFIYERHFFFSLSSGLVAKRFGIPLVVEVNELAGFQRVRRNYLAGLAKKCERSLFNRATVISVVSKFLRDAIIEQYPEVHADKIHVVPNGVEESFFTRSVDGASIRRDLGIEDKIVFGFIGFFLREKSWHHLDWFIPAFIEAVKDHPSAVLLLIGGGPGRDDLEEIGQSMDFKDRMIFTGAIDNVGIGNYIDAMDIGVIPHTNEYRSPIKLFEYMAYGKPVLAPNQEPVESIVGEVQPYYLFEAKSHTSLKKAISIVLEDRENWLEKGGQLKELAKSKYTYEKHGVTILRLLG
ncbi:MAG: glycosyltransferase [Candidatus Latescibacteria bacterium]|nr:glycosyltransferase [Candidatus Latescibacterota bacterium]NIM21488.1 glycosyltransferase [Candidatus Latescibacterota bacterium]NIM65659.1 glycosyltransferase [Candidatus Latescibacterota bacterium]NIO02041.1 glycosyltransferase [Candidatus Latescibacterota bacterium]NIO28853.1 glycosyltransferase [Candidatus Latescibacterota bacterium]